MYYVYELIDPVTGLPFYVGKGTNNRSNNHYSESEWWYNKRKAKKIKTLLENNLRYKVKKVFYTNNENTAYEYESNLIKKYGRKGFEENGILTNLTIDCRPPSRKGKPGTFKGKKHTNETKEKLREANRKQFSDPLQIEIRRKKSKELWKDPEFRKRHSESRKNREATKPSTYEVFFPDSKKIIVTNLAKWCKENDYPCGTLRDTLPQRKNKPAKSGKAAGIYIRLLKK